MAAGPIITNIVHGVLSCEYGSVEVARMDSDGQAAIRVGQYIDQVMRSTPLVLHGPSKVYCTGQHTTTSC